MITPIAMSITLPRLINSLNSFMNLPIAIPSSVVFVLVYDSVHLLQVDFSNWVISKTWFRI
jgi:hypothetical protein